MKETKFTPGPWKVAEGGTRIVAGQFTFFLGAKIGAYPEEWQADARLIAAAPRLYEALEKALPYLRSHMALTPDDGPGDRIALDFAEAALAEARGEE